MMLYPSIDEIRQKADSRYTLVILASKRARDIVAGKPLLMDDPIGDKPVSQAAYEINETYIKYTKGQKEEAE